MTVTIESPLGTTHPTLWMELATVRQGLSRVVTGPTGTPAAIIHGPRPAARSSRLLLLFTDETESAACEAFHAAGGIHTITDPDRPTHSMRYVVSGQITRTLDTGTASVWILELDVQEVPA